MATSAKLEAALDSRDMKLTNELLIAVRDVRVLLIGSDNPHDKEVGDLAKSLFSGRYEKARELRERVASNAKPERKDAETFAAKMGFLRENIPAKDLPAAGVMEQEVEGVLSSFRKDHFEVQERLTNLVRGLEAGATPSPLSKFQVRLAKETSWRARQRGTKRKGPKSGPVQEGEDCYIRALYDLPIPALDTLRNSESYERFRERVEEMFPEGRIVEYGLSMDDFPTLLRSMGLTTRRLLLTGSQLEELLANLGAVIGAVAWFDKDVSKMDSIHAINHWHQHAIIIKGIEGPPDARLFAVRDSLLEHETLWTFAELGLMQLVIFTVEPAPG